MRSGETARGAVAVQDAAAPAPEDNPGVLLIAQMAWISFLEALREKRQLFGSAVAVYGMLQLLKAFAQAALVDPLIGQQTTLSRIFLTQLGLDTLFSFAGAFVLAAVAVPVHRMILRDEHGDGVIKPFSGLVVRFAMWVLAIDMAGALIVSPAIMGSISNPGLRGAIFAMAAIMIVAVIYVTVRWSLAFPAIATGRPIDTRAGNVGAFTRPVLEVVHHTAARDHSAFAGGRVWCVDRHDDHRCGRQSQLYATHGVFRRAEGTDPHWAPGEGCAANADRRRRCCARGGVAVVELPDRTRAKRFRTVGAKLTRGHGGGPTPSHCDVVTSSPASLLCACSPAGA